MTLAWYQAGQHCVLFTCYTSMQPQLEVKAFKSLESYNYLQCGWVRSPECAPNERGCHLHQMPLSETVTGCKQFCKNIWVCAKSTGEVITAGCICMAGQARVCSHVDSVFWKVDLAAARGLAGLSSIDNVAQWNKGTKRNVEPKRLSEIKFRLKNRSVDEPALRWAFPTCKFFTRSCRTHGFSKSRVCFLIKCFACAEQLNII